MSSDQSHSHNVNISGAQLTNVQIGGQAGRDLSTVQFHQIDNTTLAESLTQSDMVVFLNKLNEFLQDSSLSSVEKEKVGRSIKTAQDEVQADEPDRKFISECLERVAQVLKKTDATVEAGTSLWEKVKPLLEPIAGWLGAASKLLM